MEALKALREEKNISQQKLADETGTTQQSIYRYENGLYEPDIGMLIQLAQYFNTSVDYLVGNTDIRRKIEKVEQYELNDTESHLVDTFRELSADFQKSLLVMLDTLAKTGK